MTQQTDAIEKQVLLRAPRGRVWSAITSAEEFGAWFRATLTGEFAPGATVAGEMTYPGVEGMPIELSVVEMDPPSRLAFRWRPYEAGPGEDPASIPTTLVTFTLDDTPEGTLLTLVESGFDALPLERRAQALGDNTEGWEMQVQNLADYLAARV